MYQTTSIMKAKAILETLFVIGFWEHSNFCMLCTSTVTGATLRGIYIERSYSPATLKRLRHCKAAAVQIMLTDKCLVQNSKLPSIVEIVCVICTRLKIFLLTRDSSDCPALSPSFSALLDHLVLRCLVLPALHCVSRGRPMKSAGQRSSIPPFWSESYRSVSNNQSLGSSLSRPIMDSSISSFLFHWDITHLCATPT